MTRALLSIAALASSVVASGCMGGSTGTLHLFVTDQPGDIEDFESLNVTVDKIVLKGGEGGKNRTYEPAKAVLDLTRLTDANATELFNGSVPAGGYNYLEIRVSDAQGVLKADGSTVDVRAPSNRLFLNTHFTIAEGEETHVLFDMQVHRQGNDDYMLKPNAAGSRVVEAPPSKTVSA